MANYLDNARKKKGLKRVVVDNTKSLFVDDVLIKAAREEAKKLSGNPAAHNSSQERENEEHIGRRTPKPPFRSGGIHLHIANLLTYIIAILEQ